MVSPDVIDWNPSQSCPQLEADLSSTSWDSHLPGDRLCEQNHPQHRIIVKTGQGPGRVVRVQRGKTPDRLSREGSERGPEFTQKLLISRGMCPSKEGLRKQLAWSVLSSADHPDLSLGKG